MQLNQYIDHTLLKADGAEVEIKKVIEEAKMHEFASVCVNPFWVKLANELLKDSKVAVCTVIGFPLGANTMETKVFETENAIKNGADEIDMVINIGALKSGYHDYVEEEIQSIVKAANNKIVKVIIETCYLKNEEIELVSQMCARSGATFVKTSTGFGTYGATVEHVKLMKEASKLKIKASGGVRSKDDAEKMIAAGASRIGTSGGVQIMQNQENQEQY